jgi:hypothetical protein
VNYGFVFPGGDARDAADIAHDAEQAGWDGFFVWEPVWGVDAWVSLTAAAMQTGHIRLGTMLTPLSRMRPWKLASETATLDRLSKGRIILSVGLGALDSGFEAFGEVTDRKVRAELLDEGLDILTGLWEGQPFTYFGKHYHIEPTSFFPPPAPIQRPRIPIWVVGAWPSQKSMLRVLRYDGLLPSIIGPNGKGRPITTQDIREMKTYIDDNRADTTPFDIIMEGVMPTDNAQKTASFIHEWEAAGITWWLESMWHLQGRPDGLRMLRKRVQKGPPRPQGDHSLL